MTFETPFWIGLVVAPAWSQCIWRAPEGGRLWRAARTSCWTRTPQPPSNTPRCSRRTGAARRSTPARTGACLPYIRTLRALIPKATL
eukprot:147716-Prorocentrum_minimum.AAC.2